MTLIDLPEISNSGYISGINGSLLTIKGLGGNAKLHDLIKITSKNFLAEIIQIFPDYIVAQCYENTIRLKLFDEVKNLYHPLSMELAPGLLSNIFDGIQRPLNEIYNKTNNYGFIKRGFEIDSLSKNRKWYFEPKINIGEILYSGDIVGIVQETPLIEHKIMVPPNNSGKVTFIVKEGDYTIKDEIYHLKKSGEEKSFKMAQYWPIYKKRPFKKKHLPHQPFLTGLRVIDLLFPVAKGGTVALPGGFGTGKSVIQQSLAKWSNADIVIFIGCGERGNEIAHMLKEFSELIDPKTKRPLIERVVLIANTSNMPVAAREASIFSGITIAEYFRDMGYDIAVLADSTSRWAESLREISGLLEEMPTEEGYPAYLPSKLSKFYERAGFVEILGRDVNKNSRKGSITIIGSVSPPSGDFSEPVTATTKRFVQAFWALDQNLAYSKHYPAINWLESYSSYSEYLSEWWHNNDINWDEINLDWYQCRAKVERILSVENELKNITQLIGEENLPEDQQLILFISKLIRNAFLIQSAFDIIDNYTTSIKLLCQIKIILLLYSEAERLLNEGFIMADIINLESINKIRRISQSIPNDDFFLIEELKNELLKEIKSIEFIYED